MRPGSRRMAAMSIVSKRRGETRDTNECHTRHLPVLLLISLIRHSLLPRARICDYTDVLAFYIVVTRVTSIASSNLRLHNHGLVCGLLLDSDLPANAYGLTTKSHDWRNIVREVWKIKDLIRVLKLAHTRSFYSYIT